MVDIDPVGPVDPVAPVGPVIPAIPVGTVGDVNGEIGGTALLVVHTMIGILKQVSKR
ncbi:hypothetical protein [Bacillus cereus]|uniref:hypothetical protein n=1 Tax=Bacillus cereus TaxID=1396 RepID=UPI003D646FA0